MGVNRILRFLVVCIISFTFFSCKGYEKKEQSAISDIKITSEEQKTKNQKTTENSDQNQLIDFTKVFYKTYLSFLNNDINTANLEKYLSDDLIKYLGRLDYDGIIFAQDNEKFDLSKLKVTETRSNMIYKVEFINMGHETIVYAKIESLKKPYRISNLTTNFNEASTDIVLSELVTDQYDFDFLKYYIKAREGSPANTAIIYSIENFDADTAIFSKYTYNDNFEYLCIKQKTSKGLELYYKRASDYSEYTGDISIPLITIYKKGEEFYAKSSLIEEGKEIKLNEEF
ncbi:hypothetical protein [Aquimarina agarivorans]|uniref:hypothetical protein n=1 Tax=Aquimarina agarivorans TaxID=980584 RepID=UPI000248E9F7|nr:hypothetical protein [Aquimarina agarivorans]